MTFKTAETIVCRMLMSEGSWSSFILFDLFSIVVSLCYVKLRDVLIFGESGFGELYCKDMG